MSWRTKSHDWKKKMIESGGRRYVYLFLIILSLFFLLSSLFLTGNVLMGMLLVCSVTVIRSGTNDGKPSGVVKIVDFGEVIEDKNNNVVEPVKGIVVVIY